MVIREFSTMEVCALTKLPYGTLFGWIKIGLVTPSIAKAQGRGKPARWDFRDLVAIHTAHKLRQHGISVPGIRKVVQYIQKHLAINNPLSECWLATDGKEVYMVDGDALLALLRHQGQRTLLHLVDMRQTTDELRSKTVPLPKKRGRKPLLKPPEQQEPRATSA